MVAVMKRKLATIQNTNEPVRRSEVVDVEISSAEFNAPVSHSWRQSWYLRYCESLHTKGKLGRCCMGLLIRFVFQRRFAYGARPSTGRGVAGASCIRKNKNRENFESGRFSAKICTSENFPLCGSFHSRFLIMHYILLLRHSLCSILALHRTIIFWAMHN